MPAIDPRGARSPKSLPAVVTAAAAARGVIKGTHTQSWPSRRLSRSGGKKKKKSQNQKTFLNRQAPSCPRTYIYAASSVFLLCVITFVFTFHLSGHVGSHGDSKGTELPDLTPPNGGPLEKDLEETPSTCRTPAREGRDHCLRNTQSLSHAQ